MCVRCSWRKYMLEPWNQGKHRGCTKLLWNMHIDEAASTEVQGAGQDVRAEMGKREGSKQRQAWPDCFSPSFGMQKWRGVLWPIYSSSSLAILRDTAKQKQVREVQRKQSWYNRHLQKSWMLIKRSVFRNLFKIICTCSLYGSEKNLKLPLEHNLGNAHGVCVCVCACISRQVGKNGISFGALHRKLNWWDHKCDIVTLRSNLT